MSDDNKTTTQSETFKKSFDGISNLKPAKEGSDTATNETSESAQKQSDNKE